MEELKFPFSFKELTDEEKEIIKIHKDKDIVRLESSKCCYTKLIEEFGPMLYNFKPRPDDIWLVGYPRSGTTMTQEIVYILGTDLNYEKARSTIMDFRFPYLESVLIWDKKNDEQLQKFLKSDALPEAVKQELIVKPHVKLENSKEKRFIKSHLGFSLLNPQLLEVGCKVVFIVRNVKDCMVSDYYYPSNAETKKEYGFYKFWEVYKKHLCVMSNYFEMLKEGWERRNNKNLLFLFYEDVNADKRAAIRKIAEFLDKKLTEEELETLVGHMDIKKFKENKSLNNDHLVDLGFMVKDKEFSFIRQGKSGGWRELLTPEINKEVDEWIKENLKEIPDFEMPECWKKAMDLE